ncbi:MAG: DUF2911 domain-containing protein, partial [Myxococcota bacterium]
MTSTIARATRSLAAVGLAAVLMLPATAEAGHPSRKSDASRASKNGKLEGAIDGVSMTLTYGRPKVKDRDLWGKLVPYGKVWRAGADEATAVTFSKAVKINGKALPAGSYAFFAIPNKDKWTLVFNSQAEQWGAYSYDSSKDVLRVDVAP